MQNESGLSTLELVVVVAILAISAAIAFPNLSNMRENMALKGEARKIYEAAMLARGEAVKRQVNSAIAFNQDVDGSKHNYVVFQDDNGDCVFDSAEDTILLSEQFPDAISFDTSEGGGDGITFTSTGSDSSGPPCIAFQPNTIPTKYGGGFAQGAVYLKNSTRDISVVIATGGNIHIDN